MHNNTGNILHVRLLFRDTFCLVPYPSPSPHTPPPPPQKPKDGLANIQNQGGGGEGSEANGNLHCDPVSNHPGYSYPPYVSDHTGWSSCIWIANVLCPANQNKGILQGLAWPESIQRQKDWPWSAYCPASLENRWLKEGWISSWCKLKKDVPFCPEPWRKERIGRLKNTQPHSHLARLKTEIRWEGIN